MAPARLRLALILATSLLGLGAVASFTHARADEDPVQVQKRKDEADAKAVMDHPEELRKRKAAAWAEMERIHAEQVANGPPPPPPGPPPTLVWEPCPQAPIPSTVEAPIGPGPFNDFTLSIVMVAHLTVNGSNYNVWTGYGDEDPAKGKVVVYRFPKDPCLNERSAYEHKPTEQGAGI